MSDWVATYEISDVMKVVGKDTNNLFFQRICSFEFPDLIKDVKHEELRRLKEEEPFKGHMFLIEKFGPKHKLMTLSEWTGENHTTDLPAKDKPLVFIGDLKGHFVTFMACKVLNDDGSLESTLLIFNSIDLNYLHCSEVLFTMTNLCFQDDKKKEDKKQL
jgi:hypothetical protein